jgi:hypothetical protein
MTLVLIGRFGQNRSPPDSYHLLFEFRVVGYQFWDNISKQQRQSSKKESFRRPIAAARAP